LQSGWLAVGYLAQSFAHIQINSAGDYDGDKGVVFYDPDIVKNFQNADEKYSYEPKGLAVNFSQNTDKVADVLERIRGESPISQLQELQKFLLGAIRDTSMVGKYSSYHDHAIYTLGYNHPETIRLNYM
jgi:RNA-dependent RNA polymerase